MLSKLKSTAGDGINTFISIILFSGNGTERREFVCKLRKVGMYSGTKSGEKRKEGRKEGEG